MQIPASDKVNLKAQYTAWFGAQYRREVYDLRQKAQAYPDCSAERTQLRDQADDALKQLYRARLLPKFIPIRDDIPMLWGKAINEVTGMNGGIELSIFG